MNDNDNGLPASAHFSSLTLETSNALLSPFGSHFRWWVNWRFNELELDACDGGKVLVAMKGVE
jgi:hypothetical protein